MPAVRGPDRRRLADRLTADLHNCEIGAAVANAVSAVKQTAHLVLSPMGAAGNPPLGFAAVGRGQALRPAFRNIQHPVCYKSAYADLRSLRCASSLAYFWPSISVCSAAQAFKGVRPAGGASR